MPRHPRHRCKDCGVTDGESVISKSGLCPLCAAERQRVMIAAMRGEIDLSDLEPYRRWRNGVARGGRPQTSYSPNA